MQTNFISVHDIILIYSDFLQDMESDGPILDSGSDIKRLVRQSINLDHIGTYFHSSSLLFSCLRFTALDCLHGDVANV